MKTLLPLTALALASCATTPRLHPQQKFFANLSSLCGNSFSGRLVSADPQDAEMRGQPLVAHFHGCTTDRVHIRFHVGSDMSRNWVVNRTVTGLELKHVHRHADGHEDELSRYGGHTVTTGTSWRQEFPADAFSKELFARRAIPASASNVWAMEVRPEGLFAYELRRPDRNFRVEFVVPIGQVSLPWPPLH